MKALLLVGGGGHCRAAIDVVEAEGQYLIKGIVQPKTESVMAVLGYPILGEDADLPELLRNIPHALVTVGQIKTPALRQRLYDSLKTCNAIVPSIVSPHAYIARDVQIGEGTVIMHGAIVNTGAHIGVNGIINSLVLVEHDAAVGNHCHISTGAKVNGGVIVGDGCFVGSGAVLGEGVRIGINCIIGAGCVITRDVASNTMIRPRP
jgi:sugar O-acyltransferase (sialic acid O-acetyltransferase NeuD family)